MRALLFLLFTVLSISAQYELTRSVVATGGGDVAGGTYAGTTTIGQPAVGGFITFGLDSEYTGFWSPGFAPTAAGISITGRVLAPSGAGLSGATLYLTQQNGQTLVARSSGFGYYQFDDVEVGQTVIISVVSKRYVYTPRTLSLRDSIAEFDFLPVE